MNNLGLKIKERRSNSVIIFNCHSYVLYKPFGVLKLLHRAIYNNIFSRLSAMKHELHKFSYVLYGPVPLLTYLLTYLLHGAESFLRS